jgi:hypothetical protein
MVSVLTSNAVDRGFEPWSGQTKDYIKLGSVSYIFQRQHSGSIHMICVSLLRFYMSLVYMYTIYLF